MSTIECDRYSQISTSQDNLSLSSMNIDITDEEPPNIVSAEKKMHMCLTCGKDSMTTGLIKVKSLINPVRSHFSVIRVKSLL